MVLVPAARGQVASRHMWILQFCWLLLALLPLRWQFASFALRINTSARILYEDHSAEGLQVLLSSIRLASKSTLTSLARLLRFPYFNFARIYGSIVEGPAQMAELYQAMVANPPMHSIFLSPLKLRSNPRLARIVLVPDPALPPLRLALYPLATEELQTDKFDLATCFALAHHILTLHPTDTVQSTVWLQGCIKTLFERDRVALERFVLVIRPLISSPLVKHFKETAIEPYLIKSLAQRTTLPSLLRLMSLYVFEGIVHIGCFLDRTHYGQILLNMYHGRSQRGFAFLHRILEAFATATKCSARVLVDLLEIVCASGFEEETIVREARGLMRHVQPVGLTPERSRLARARIPPQVRLVLDIERLLTDHHHPPSADQWLLQYARPAPAARRVQTCWFYRAELLSPDKLAGMINGIRSPVDPAPPAGFDTSTQLLFKLSGGAIHSRASLSDICLKYAEMVWEPANPALLLFWDTNVTTISFWSAFIKCWPHLIMRGQRLALGSLFIGTKSRDRPCTFMDRMPVGDPADRDPLFMLAFRTQMRSDCRRLGLDGFVHMSALRQALDLDYYLFAP